MPRSLPQSIDPNHATPSDRWPTTSRSAAAKAMSTTHFSVIDKDGMAVSNTYTLENSYGSRIVVHGAGFIFNNEMTDFNWRPGVTNRRGVIGTPPNLIAPGKRMLSSQSPTIVAKDGKVLLITGSPGSRTITNTVLCVVVNVLDFDMDVQSAVDSPRMHHPGSPTNCVWNAFGPIPRPWTSSKPWVTTSSANAARATPIPSSWTPRRDCITAPPMVGSWVTRPAIDFWRQWR